VTAIDQSARTPICDTQHGEGHRGHRDTRVVQAEWCTFERWIESGERAVPWFCVREVGAFLRCGILGHGFARCWQSRGGRPGTVSGGGREDPRLAGVIRPRS